MQQCQAATAIIRPQLHFPRQPMERTRRAVQSSWQLSCHRRTRQVTPSLPTETGLAFQQGTQPLTSLNRCRLLQSVNLAARQQHPLHQMAQQHLVLTVEQHSRMAGQHRAMLVRTCQHSKMAI